LGLLESVFPKVPILGLTATDTIKARSQIVQSLGLIQPIVIETNPDRSNIYFQSSRRPDRGDDKLANILDPLINELGKKRLDCPVTLDFGNLETISSYAYFSDKMGKKTISSCRFVTSRR
jgi:superfamily II DNA helicase RecQ